MVSQRVSQNTAPRAPHTPRAPRWNIVITSRRWCLGFNWISRKISRKRQISEGENDEVAKRPITRCARLLAARCARCRQCARCGVSWHRSTANGRPHKQDGQINSRGTALKVGVDRFNSAFTLQWLHDCKDATQALLPTHTVTLTRVKFHGCYCILDLDLTSNFCHDFYYSFFSFYNAMESKERWSPSLV